MKSIKRKKEQNMLYVVRQYVWAKTALQAIKIAAKSPPQEAWVDEDFKKRLRDPKDAIGFEVQDPEGQF